MLKQDGMLDPMEEKLAALGKRLGEQSALTGPVVELLDQLSVAMGARAAELNLLEGELKGIGIDPFTRTLTYPDHHLRQVIEEVLELQHVDLLLKGIGSEEMANVQRETDRTNVLLVDWIVPRQCGLTALETEEVVSDVQKRLVFAINQAVLMSRWFPEGLDRKMRELTGYFLQPALYVPDRLSCQLILQGKLATGHRHVLTAAMRTLDGLTVPGLRLGYAASYGACTAYAAVWYTAKFYRWIKMPLPEGQLRTEAVVHMWKRIVRERAKNQAYRYFGDQLVAAAVREDVWRNLATRAVRNLAFVGMPAPQLYELSMHAREVFLSASQTELEPGDLRPHWSLFRSARNARLVRLFEQRLKQFREGGHDPEAAAELYCLKLTHPSVLTLP